MGRLILGSDLIALLGPSVAMSAGAQLLGQSRFAGYSFATVGLCDPQLLGFKVTSGSQTPLRVQVLIKCLDDQSPAPELASFGTKADRRATD